MAPRARKLQLEPDWMGTGADWIEPDSQIAGHISILIHIRVIASTDTRKASHAYILFYIIAYPKRRRAASPPPRLLRRGNSKSKQICKIQLKIK